jgi:hypothetical protein
MDSRMEIQGAGDNPGASVLSPACPFFQQLWPPFQGPLRDWVPQNSLQTYLVYFLPLLG